MANENLLIATNFSDTEDTANGWISYIKQFNYKN